MNKLLHAHNHKSSGALNEHATILSRCMYLRKIPSTLTTDSFSKIQSNTNVLEKNLPSSSLTQLHVSDSVPEEELGVAFATGNRGKSVRNVSAGRTVAWSEQVSAKREQQKSRRSDF